MGEDVRCSLLIYAYSLGGDALLCDALLCDALLCDALCVGFYVWGSMCGALCVMLFV